MIVHFFTKEDELPGSSRQRAFRVAEEIELHGIKTIVHRPSAVEISVTSWPQKLSLIHQILKAFFSVKKGDIIFLHRTISNKYFFIIEVLYIKLFRRKTIFDFDDAIYLHDPFKTKFLTRIADTVIVCSKTLETWVKKYNNRVYIIHTLLKFEKYQKYTKNYNTHSEKLTLGWIGTATDHYKNLQLLAQILTLLAAHTTIAFRFILVGSVGSQKVYDLFKNIPNLEVTFVDNLEWNNPDAVPRMIQTFDIGVMPLVDRGEWNEARSSFKAMEYMACGVATICSEVGEIKNVIEDNQNGFLADTVDEWVEKLHMLLSDIDLRARLGTAGQKYIAAYDCYEAAMPIYKQILEEI